MVKVKWTWREKRLAKEEGESNRSGNEDGQGGREEDKGQRRRWKPGIMSARLQWILTWCLSYLKSFVH
jgi:hypothetical protein